jgi:zinc D-Ala-D-Ala carboxypeptidase
MFSLMKRRSFLALIASTPLFAQTHLQSDDIYLSYESYMTLRTLNQRLKRLRSFVGYANFNLLSYQNALFYARNYSQIGSFTSQELSLVERLFFEDPKQYGFYGKRTCDNIEMNIDEKDVIKIPHTGHYIFKGEAEQKFHRLSKDVGETLVLTSGIRNVIKQLSLYVNKIDNCNGNMSKASISLAPPGYSYHTIGDFDVGRKGWGYKNFTASFAQTQEFSRLRGLDYIRIRYTENNTDGVRFEPWHVEIT